MSNFSTRFKELRQELKMTQDELAAKLDISKSAVSMYENGRRIPRYEDMEAIADLFNVDMEYLSGRSDMKHRPLYEAAAGQGIMNDGFPTETVPIAPSTDEHCIRVNGRSMEPTLLDGDVVIVKATSDIPNRNQIALVKVDGNEATLKRVRIDDTGLWLLADNADVYPPNFFTKDEVESLPVTVVGVVVKLIRDM